MAISCLCSQYKVLSTGDTTGCTEVVAEGSRFRMGHDSKLKSLLIRAGKGLHNVVSMDSGIEYTALEVATQHGFATQVQHAIDRKKPAKKEKVVASLAAMKNPPVMLKVGRWTYPGILLSSGGATYLDKKGTLHMLDAGKFQVVTP